MVSIRIKYLSDKIEKLRYIDGKSDWIDLRAAERVELKAGEFRLIPLGIAMAVSYTHLDVYKRQGLRTQDKTTAARPDTSTTTTKSP